ncbi:glutamyl-tRNA reductase [candidate division KSB3 bacterium]|uniref:Glutamyl-tRNA reductase n=1 Tax=candidate division KSB3 bacterium TaxID=2044937 RepID=A0A9D5K020_9BACT|nr:glutamyl-tRNA reductase [candidate division KSB3 bacterium]MBD3326917.1 glutamyl-tRNA reductase [candidate division KSB3 bacterium]
MVISVFGINHRITALEDLEQITFSQDDVQRALPLLLREPGIEEGVILSTCNRLEVYTVCQEGFPAQHFLPDFLKHLKPQYADSGTHHFYYKEKAEAIAHLFRVSSSLDSLVIGENEIAGQVKEAYRTACALKTTGMLTNKLFHAAFRTSKRVKTETKINEGNCSISYVAVDLAEHIFPELHACRVLLIGAGAMGKAVAKNLAQRGVAKILIANRHLQKAVDLAQEVEGTAIPLTAIEEHIDAMDVIVSGTGSPDYLLRADQMQTLLTQPRSKPLLMIDIALPRDFDPQIALLPDVILKNLYDLKEVVDLNLKRREQEIPKVKAIIAEEVQKFLYWRESLKIKPVIQTLTTNFEAIRSEELDRQKKQIADDDLSEMDRVTKALTQKYVHVLISRLKELHKVCSLDAQQIHIIEQLFDSHEISE